MPTNCDIELKAQGDNTQITITGLATDLPLLMPAFLNEWSCREITLPAKTQDERLQVILLDARLKVGKR